MAGSTRFESTSNSLEGSLLTTAYPNGQRGTNVGPNLDRSGSFRENIENRMLTSGSATSRGGTLSVETPSLTQLGLEQFSLGEQKLTCLGELRRILGTASGVASEYLSIGAVHSKPVIPVASEELRRFKASVVDTSTSARDRAKMFTESIVKLDKSRLIVLSRKRQRNEIPSSGANLLKIGSQIHQNASDTVTQRLEDRTKNAVPNKRVRTSVADSEGRNTSLLRQGMVIDKERDLLRAGKGGSVQVEDKIRGLPTGGDGWDKKMKRKRSVGTMVTRTMEGDRELKRGMQQRLNVESRSRPCDGHGFRSGSSSGIIGINKLDGSSQPTSSSARTAPRNDVDNVSVLSDRRDRAAGLDKERVIAKCGNKLNLREDSQLGNTIPVTKGKASRAPRTGSGVLANSSSNIPRAVGALEGWEQPPCSNKAQTVNGTNNRKRPMSTGSSSPPVAQWGGQRPHKNARTRRTNLVSPVSNHDEAPISSGGFPTSDIGSRLPSTESGGPLLAKGISNNSQQFKLKPENVPSPAGLSESEESGAGESKLKEKGLDNGEIEDRAVHAVQKVGSFTMKKNKIFIKEEIGDGVRRQGRSGRGSTQSRGCVPFTREKLENMATTKPLRNTKPGFEKSEIKSGRPPTKKRAFTRPGKVVNSGSSEFTGESDDDNEELLAAANSARSASYHGCTGSFWKKMEPIFAFVSPEDMTYLKKQINFAEELDESFCHMFGDHNLMDELMGKAPPSSQALAYGERQGSPLNGMGQKQCAQTTRSHDESWDGDSLHGKLETEKWLEKIIPLSQRLLSAFIVEDETEEFDHNSELRNASFQYTSDDSPCGTCSHNDNGDRLESEIESEVDLKASRLNNVDNFSCDGSTASNGFRSPNIRTFLCNDEPWQEEDTLGHPEVGQNNLYGSHSVHTKFSGISSFECQYQQMCLDDRILAELNSIGLFPEIVPDLTEEDEEINKDVSELQKVLYQQVSKKKGKLHNVDKTIQKGREMEERDLEQLSMTKLAEMAYKKYMSCRGSSNKGGVSKVAKQAALAFMKRTLARCQKFEESGRSCFSEPALRGVIFSPIVYSNDSKSIDYSQPESRASAAGALASGNASCTAERHGSIIDKLDRAPLDAFQALINTPDQTFTKHESPSNRGKKREVLLDDVGVSASRVTSTLANTLLGGSKGKRSERERDQNKDISARGSVAKAGRPSLGNSKGERKTKTKPKQKTAQLSTSLNGLVSRFTETTNAVCETVTNITDKVDKEVGNFARDTLKETEEPIDFSNLQLPGLDFMEELDGPVDLAWFNIDDECLQDQDLVGLEIPMDDLNMVL